MATKIKQHLVFKQTAEGTDTTLRPGFDGWFPLDINFPSNAQRAYLGTKDTSDIITVQGKMSAKNPLTSEDVTIVCSLTSYGSGIVEFNEAVLAPIDAIRFSKTGTNGEATIILAG
jgi:hypothetical protein